MLKVQNVSLLFSDRKLFDDVNITLHQETVMGYWCEWCRKINIPKKILSGELQPTTGEVILDPHERLTVLKQDHFCIEDETLSIQ